MKAAKMEKDIDEAIKKYYKLSKSDKTCYPEEAQQLAEWLEELKELRTHDGVFKQILWERNVAISQIEELGGQLGEKTELIRSRIYNKTIDGFREKLKSDEFQKYNLDMVFETSRDLSYSHCINAFYEYIDEMAKQLKEDGINEIELYKHKIREIQALAIPTLEDDGIVSYVKLSDVIEILQENASMEYPLE